MSSVPPLPGFRVLGKDYSRNYYLDRQTRWELNLGTKPVLHDIYDSAAQRFLVELDAWLEVREPRQTWLSLRQDFRRVEGAWVGLALYASSSEPPALCVAIWLLGRSDCKRVVPLLRRFAEHASEPVRFHAVKALWRLRAYDQLEAMAELDTSPRVRRIAAAAQRVRGPDLQIASREKPFDSRLGRFLECSVEPIPEDPTHPRARMPFWSMYPFFAEVRPKSAAFIREILERIRAAVRGALP